jgi:hypothetical protein
LKRALARRCFAACAVALAATVAFVPASAAEPPPVRDRQAIMRLVVQGWLETQQPDGFLPYGFDFLADRATDEPTSKGYIIRQAGALYEWAEYYRHSQDVRFREPLQRGITALAQRSLVVGKSRAQDWLEATRILSLPAGRRTLAATLQKLGLLYQIEGTGKLVSADGEHGGAWAGATAFALLTEMTYWRASGDNRYANLRAAWLDGLLTLWMSGAGFRERPPSIDQSDYYNGEVWLALAVYADLHRNDEKVVRALADVDRTMMKKYGEEPSHVFYSWGALSAAQRWRTTGDPRFLDFLKQQAAIFVERFPRDLGPDDNNCAAMEGLAATLGTLAASGEANHALAEPIRRYLQREALQLPRLQIEPGQTKLPLGGQAYLATPRLAQFGGGFLAGRFKPETRIDAASHCLSALLMIEEQSLLER